MNRAEIAEQLRKDHLYDGGRLRPLGKAEVTKTLEAWAARGKVAWLVMLPEDSDLAPYHELFSDLHLSEERDLLFLFNGRRWEARGWKLGTHDIARALALAEPRLKQNWAAGLSFALDTLGARAIGAPALNAPAAQETGTPPPMPARAEEPERGSSGKWVGGGIAGAVVLGGLSFVVVRRKRLLREQAESVHAALLSAEQAEADLMLFAEELPKEDVREVHVAAERLHEELGRLRRSSQDERLRLGKIQQIENELAALHSTALQKKMKKS